MNRKLTVILSAAFAMASIGGASLNAQELGIANIPFNFQVQSQKMPAGKYEIRQMNIDNTMLFNISDGRGDSRFVLAPHSGTTNPKDAKLTFSCERDACTLVRIALPGSPVAHTLVPDSAYKVGVLSVVRVVSANR